MLVTKRSEITGVEHTLEVPCTAEQLIKWSEGQHIQVAMPDVPAPLREFLMTGITPEEWDSMFGEEDGS